MDKDKIPPIKSYDIIQDSKSIMYKNEQPKVVITDMDDVLCNTVETWVQFLYANKELFSGVYNIDPMPTTEDVYNRKAWGLIEWLKKDDVELPKEIEELTLAVLGRPDFYSYCKPTKFAYSLREFLEHKLCKELIIITRNVSEGQNDSKIAWLKNFFGEKLSNSPKLKYLAVDDDESKAQAIRENNVIWDSFIDDELRNVTDMVLHTQGFGNEILIPTYGYNQPTPEFSTLVKDFNLQVYYFNNTV
jgi:hypothetical protein